MYLGANDGPLQTKYDWHNGGPTVAQSLYNVPKIFGPYIEPTDSVCYANVGPLLKNLCAPLRHRLCANVDNFRRFTNIVPLDKITSRQHRMSIKGQ